MRCQRWEIVDTKWCLYLFMMVNDGWWLFFVGMMHGGEWWFTSKLLSLYYCGPKTMTGWWFGTSILFSHILGISSSQLTFFFFRGVALAHQPDDGEWSFLVVMILLDVDLNISYMSVSRWKIMWIDWRCSLLLHQQMGWWMGHFCGIYYCCNIYTSLQWFSECFFVTNSRNADIMGENMGIWLMAQPLSYVSVSGLL